MRAACLVLLAAAVLVTGCGGDEQASPASPTTTAEIGGGSEPGTTTKPKPRKPRPALEDGRHFGYLQAARLTAEPREAVFDLAYFLTGAETNAAAEERGAETPVPNDYFVVNDNPRLRTLAAAEDVVIDLVDWRRCCEKRLAGDPARFETSFTAESPSPGLYRGSRTVYWLTVEDGVVTRIEEQYLP